MASGERLVLFKATDGYYQTASQVPLDIVNGQPVLDFAAGSGVSIEFVGFMPTFYNGTADWIIYLYLTMSSAVAGDLDWSCSVDRRNSGSDVTSDSFDTSVDAFNHPVPSTAGTLFIVSFIMDRAHLDDVQAGEKFIFRVERSDTDTATGDAEVHYVAIRER